MSRRPFVYWAQNEKQLFLTVDLKDSSDADYSIMDNLFEFRAVGVGAQGRCEYSFALPLFANVDMEKACEEGGNRLLYVLKKKDAAWWPTILSDGSRHSWLRVDFDRFKDPDESEPDDEFEMINMNARTPEAEMDAITQRILKECGTERKSTDFITKVYQFVKSHKNILAQYMFTYNIFLFLLHIYLLFAILFEFYTIGGEYYESFWLRNASRIKVAAALQLFEIIHALIGFTKSNYQTALIQVCGRLAMIYIIDGCPDVQNTVIIFMLVIVYFAIEIFRYPYYAASSFKIENSVLTWLRYHAWIPLYPCGLFLEGITIYRAIPYYYRSGKYGYHMPNVANFGFNFGAVLGIFLFFVFPFVAVHLLGHMWLQRGNKYKGLVKKTT